MEPVFSRFESYNFEVDQKFQEGLKTLNETNSTDKSRLLDMKLFFYNRFVEPIDSSAYKQWISASVNGTQKDNDEHLEQKKLSDNGDQAAEAPAQTETQQLSFAEVMRLVQEGKDVPGALKLDIQPSNQSPTPSQMERRLKPWETLAAST
nr:uncharacterized protein C6orf226 homolog [Sphaeramia orbicularis]